MSYGPITTLTIVGVLPHLPSSPSVVELGNQTFTTGRETIAKIRDALGRPDFNLPPGAGHSSEVLFRALGFRSYAAIDVNSLHGSLMMDLNRDLRADYGFTETFDLVTNNGTSEHVFNQAAVFKNMHDLTKPGGIMVHVLPYDWPNHGFYNFSPVLFFDLAAANSYEIIKFALGHPDGYAIPAVSPVEVKRPRLKKLWPFHLRNVPALSVRDLLTRSSKEPLKSAMAAFREGTRMFVAVMRKTTDAPFAIPIQGTYANAIEAYEIQARYPAQSAPVDKASVDRAFRYKIRG